MKRNVILDNARGIGIFLVILGHTLLLEYNKLVEIIYFFHMPLFFFLSGMSLYYSFKHKLNFKDYFVKKFKSIMNPYFIFSLLTFLYWALFERNFRINNVPILNTFINIFLGFVNGGLYSFNSVMWFLPCLFIIEIMFYFLIKLKNKNKVLICFTFLILGYFLSKHSILLPFGLELAFIGIFFTCSGYIYI